MNQPNILVCGNHTCGNRGDAAIMRGLLNGLAAEHPDANITVTSRYPTSSAYILKRPVVADIFSGSDIVAPGRRQATRRRMVPWSLLMRSRREGRYYGPMLPKGVRDRINHLRNYDLVVQLGGSYFIDLYGYGHFETGFAAMAADVPLILVGHSMGPVHRGKYPIMMRHLLSHATYVGLRETVSQEILEQAKMPMGRVDIGSDSAWNISPAGVDSVDPRRDIFKDPERPIVAITARMLAPFDALLNVSQAQYEAAFAHLVEALIAAGYNVLALSTCTGIDSYHRDDRMVGLRIGDRLESAAHYHVLMDEIDDLMLGAYLRACDLLVATRLHSAIIAMNFGTPAIALAYEHKSTGILRDMQLSELSAGIDELIDGRLIPRALSAAAERQTLAERIRPAVEKARERAHGLIASGLRAAGF
ncbi:polysaccharide pyruvyl transferase family protein [Salinisphaera sp. SPP-AMP-43]|uniref:polysaccharide pyruvyl transferase family protein n=1 Tax=Salinisphaera sp. SPP-AMP-43 TaxID=3121288 RepID=UPI003C6DEE7C